MLTANPNYFEGEPQIKKIIVKVIPESSSRFADAQGRDHRRGPGDVARTRSSSLRDVPGVKTVETQGFWLTHLLLNEKMVPEFANKKVRQAVNYAIDRDKIIQRPTYGMAQPMSVVYPSQYPGALDASAFPYAYNIEKAKQLMKDAGYEKGFDVDLYYQAGVLPHETACVTIKEELAKIGINVSLRKTPLGTLETLYTSKKAPFALIRIYPFAPDPNYDVGLMYDTNGFCNFGYFSEPEDRQDDQGGREHRRPCRSATRSIRRSRRPSWRRRRSASWSRKATAWPCATTSPVGASTSVRPPGTTKSSK